ncbi:uncharacterized protein CANTADRAFT_52504 [Suhomyces tanzawaensis NRRL Y-17324]|uniref:Maintenance of telomere capping protein 1 n=1 Tax=Suhomyces tanzawaensis NRRL Y-17324 TaxID=984487 RepID=A0A1E4SG10_9ASCO|nr:uncharacterized protein CANTADRAFT_52504 [Suhomyces tanzawaensis NRRL Y-17324]ODV78342.1 hypothetical protein CANTADRAFT_52504 [Suhomyces tanzawaensis NRRL Y-17324]
MSKAADDVLDFINSLPDSRSGTPKPKSAAGKDEKDEDFLEFLDELAQHEKKKPATPKPSQKFEPKKKDKEESKEQETSAKEPVPSKLEPSAGTEPQSEEAPAANANEELDIDPIGSITNWWSSEGSTKVSSLWGTIASNAQSLGEQTYQLASTTTNQINQQRQKFLEEGGDDAFSPEQHIGNISGRLNSILLTMSNQIKQGLISQDDELLNVLVVYDMYNMSYLDRLIYDNFNRVMTQVEGGIKVSVSKINHNDNSGSSDTDAKINLNMFHGKVIDGEKLCFANLESSIKDFEKLTGNQEETAEKKEIDQINKSNVFISVQPITSKLENAEETPAGEDKPVLIESNNLDSFSFTIILKDITNDITIITKTQPFPLKWAKWLNGEGLDVAGEEGGESVDASEWVKDWIHGGLDLGFGVVAQEYVIKRMGV